MPAPRPAPSDAGAQREVTALLPRVLVTYLRRVLGDEAVAEAARLSGLPDIAEAVEDQGRWFSNDELARLADAVAAVSGDPDVGRRAGEELFHTMCESGLVGLFAVDGSIAGAVRACAQYGGKMSNSRTLRVVDECEDGLALEAAYEDPADATVFACSLISGFYVLMPTLFGAVGRIAEPDCQTRGADRCRFELRWCDDPRSDLGTPEPDLQASVVRNEQGLAWFEQMQAMAADLVRAEDVEDALARIVERASFAIDAPRFLLAVESDRGRIHHVGFADDEAAGEVAAALLAGTYGESDGALVIDVASSRRRYGVIAALYAAGVEFADFERRLLGSYADHAAAALEVITSLEDARRDRDAARGLLRLAGQLASVGERSDIAARLAESVPTVVGSDIATVWFWDPLTRMLTCSAWHDTVLDEAGNEAVGLRAAALSDDDVPGITELARDPRPILVEASSAPAALGDMLAEHGIRELAIVPILAGATLHGLVTAGFRHSLDDERGADLLGRLEGLAYHAAAALENSRLLEEISHRAMHDPLTGLPNRPMLHERAAEILPAALDAGATASILFIDLDRFKNVNDTLGHRAGDELIRQVAWRIASTLRRDDLLARLGGDEFLVLLPRVDDAEHASAIASRIVDSFDQPFTIEDQELFVSCSIGIACAPFHGDDLGSLMRHADSAMYTAKARGRRTIAVEAVGPEPHRRHQLELETALHRAIPNGEMRVLYQPQLDLQTMQVVGVEALMRWNHPHEGLLAPAAFLPMAEESGLIVDLDAWMRTTAFEQAARWASDGTPVSVAVNVSTRDLHDPCLARSLATSMVSAGLSPALVELEITDRVVMDDDTLPGVLGQLKALGVRLAIDDFGTGTSVLGRLRNCPIDTLKIDKSFIDALCFDAQEADTALVRALIALAHTLGLSVVAEGIESDHQRDALHRFGCDLGQGYHLGMPMPADRVTAWLQRDRTRTLASCASG